jgi:hypothetical protein
MASQWLLSTARALAETLANALRRLPALAEEHREGLSSPWGDGRLDL